MNFRRCRLRRFVLVVVLAISLFTGLRQSFAALPLLLEPAIQFGAGLVVRQVGKQVIMTAGVAANDAAWTSAVGGWIAGAAAFIGLALVPNSTADKYQIAVSPTAALPAYDPVATGNGVYNAPFAYNDPALTFSADAASSFCLITANRAVDGVVHKLTGWWSSVSAMISACVSHRATYLNATAKAETPYTPYMILGDPVGDPPDTTPMAVSVGTKTYYVQRFVICKGLKYTGGAQDPLSDECRGSDAGGFAITVSEPKDGTKRIKAVAGGFIPDSSDPDWTAAELASFPTPSVLQFKGVASDNSPVIVQLTYDATAGLKVEEATQAGPNVVYRAMTLNPTTAVATSVSAQNVASSTPDAVLTAQSSPSTSNNTITFPSDYARTGEAAVAATSLSTALSPKLDALHTDLITTVSPPGDPSVKGSSDFESSWFGTTFDALRAWHVPGHSSVCPIATMDFSMMGRQTHLVLDAQCTIAESIKSTFAVVMVAFWTIAALFIILDS